MSQEVFKRVEKKYLLTKQKYENLMLTIEPKIEPTEFSASTVCNLYYDTPNFMLIRNSIEKPIYKEKIRIRSYNIPKPQDKVFIEIKKKCDGIVGKRRIPLTLQEAYNYTEKSIFPQISNQIMKEINYYFYIYDLQPVLYLAYDRKAYQEKENPDFRITFDSNLRSRNYDLRLEMGDYGDYYFPEPTYIMELKTLGALPLWFAKKLGELEIYPTSFSKYGNIYKKTLAQKCYKNALQVIKISNL